MSDAAQLILAIIVAWGMLQACKAVDGYSERQDQKLKIEVAACEKKCMPHPISRSNPCTCIVNEEIRK